MNDNKRPGAALPQQGALPGAAEGPRFQGNRQGAAHPTRLPIYLKYLSIAAIVTLLTLGIFARNGWLPSTDALTGKQTGRFGREVEKNAPNTGNPFAASLLNLALQIN